MKVFNPQQHQAKKRFGQNFLQDVGVIERIVKNIRPKPTDNMIEIGPGLGALTRQVLAECERMSVIELDREVIPKLRFNCDGVGQLNIFEQDALKTDFTQLAAGSRIRVIGNLPYNISTPIMFHLYDHLDVVEDMHFMLQKEVVQRMVAQPGSKTFGRLSVMTQYACDAQMLFVVPPSAFVPAPKVDSAIVRLTPRLSPLAVSDFKLFSTMVTEAFNQRRKTIRNVWKTRLDADQIEALALDPTARPENLSLEMFVKVANFVAEEFAK